MRLKNALLLTLTAFIWGTAFVAQSVGMDYIGPFTFNGVRSFIGAVTLVPCVLVLKKKSGMRGKGKTIKEKPVKEEQIIKVSIKEQSIEEQPYLTSKKVSSGDICENPDMLAQISKRDR